MINREKNIYNLLLDATEKCFLDLFKKHREQYYYCALIMTESACPCISAMSYEVLEQILDKKYDCRDEKEENRYRYKWSYADSPYFGYQYDLYFQEVNELFEMDINDKEISDSEYSNRIDQWLKIMCDVMNTLREKGVFSIGCDKNVFLNAELQPPEKNENIENAKQLNSDIVFNAWYEENSEESEGQNDINWDEIWNPKSCRVILKKTISDKKMAAKIRRDFSSSLSLSEFIKSCNCAPFIVSDNFSYDRATQLVKTNLEYLNYIKIEKIN